MLRRTHFIKAAPAYEDGIDRYTKGRFHSSKVTSSIST
jgi:hypothetical protein